MPDQNKNTKLNELDIEKTELEIEKLKKELVKIEAEKIKIESETTDLKKSWYKKPQWWAFFTSAVVSLGTVFALFVNGTYTATKIKTEKDVSILKLEKKEFEIEKDKAKKEFEIEKKSMDSLLRMKTDSLKAITLDLNSLKVNNMFLSSEKIRLANYSRQLSGEIENLKDSTVEKENTVKFIIDSIKKLNNKIIVNEIKSSSAVMARNITQKDLNYSELGRKFLQTENNQLKKELSMCKDKLTQPKN